MELDVTVLERYVRDLALEVTDRALHVGRLALQVERREQEILY
jgi:hypothetical protein